MSGYARQKQDSKKSLHFWSCATYKIYLNKNLVKTYKILLEEKMMLIFFMDFCKVVIFNFSSGRSKSSYLDRDSAVSFCTRWPGQYFDCGPHKDWWTPRGLENVWWRRSHKTIWVWIYFLHPSLKISKFLILNTKITRMNPSLYERDTFWAMFVGSFVSSISKIILAQKCYQRCRAVEKRADVNK